MLKLFNQSAFLVLSSKKASIFEEFHVSGILVLVVSSFRVCIFAVISLEQTPMPANDRSEQATRPPRILFHFTNMFVLPCKKPRRSSEGTFGLGSFVGWFRVAQRDP
jgi:hypothetical protein